MYHKEKKICNHAFRYYVQVDATRLILRLGEIENSLSTHPLVRDCREN